MNVASAVSADDVKVRLCFLVNVRKARGRSVAGGRRIGRIVVGFTGRPSCGGGIGNVLRGIMGWAGVPNAGEEEGIGLSWARLVLSRLIVVGLGGKDGLEVLELSGPSFLGDVKRGT